MSKGKLILSWILRGLLSIGFLLASLGKLLGSPSIIEMFRYWGYPDGFHFIIGFAEIALAVLLLIPRTLKIAIIGITIILVGAVLTHVLNDPLINVLRPAIFMAMLGGVYFLTFWKRD